MDLHYDFAGREFRSHCLSSMPRTVGAPAGSFLCLDFGGQGETKTCAARRVLGCPQAAAMRLDNGSADAKAHTGSVKFGGKECVEDLVPLLRGQPDSGIADGHQHLLV